MEYPIEPYAGVGRVRLGMTVDEVRAAVGSVIESEKAARRLARAVSALVATDVNEAGYREILGLRVGDSESERTWQDFFTWLTRLKSRGLSGVDPVLSDHHGRLVNAVHGQFQGATW